MPLVEGNIITVDRKGALALHPPGVATVESGENIYIPDDATGFIKRNPGNLQGKGDG